MGRRGGDEFVILVRGDVGPADLARTVGKLERSLSEPMALGTVMVRTQASIGVTVVERDDPRTAIDILRDADAAMYETKLTRRRHNTKATAGTRRTSDATPGHDRGNGRAPS